MSTSLFFSENNSLERDINVENKATKLSDIWNPNELNRCIKFTREGSFASVCLQFSDDFINYSVEIEKQLKKHIDSKVYLLADTSYGSCCVDEVTTSILNNNVEWILFYPNFIPDRCSSRSVRFYYSLRTCLPF